MGFCQTSERSVQRKEWQSMKKTWRGRGLAGITVLSPDFKLIALFSASLFTLAFHSEGWPWDRACLEIGNLGNQFLPWLQVSFYLATSSSVCFSAYVSPSAFLLLELYDACRPSSLFSFMNLFPLVLLCLYSVISGKNRTCMHVLSPSFGTWRQLSHFCIPLTLCLWVRHWRAWSKRMASISIKFLLFSWNAL